MSDVLSLIESIKNVAGESPCKKKVQKIAYLIQEANAPDDLGFDFSIHFFGPYSRDLDSEIRYFYNCGDLNVEITNYEHRLSVNNHEDATPVNQAVQNIIDKFARKNPSELELLATTLYIQREVQDARRQDIVNGVFKIKGSKYSETQISEAIQELESNDYFLCA